MYVFILNGVTGSVILEVFISEGLAADFVDVFILIGLVIIMG
jgi:hypothetical protein